MGDVTQNGQAFAVPADAKSIYFVGGRINSSGHLDYVCFLEMPKTFAKAYATMGHTTWTSNGSYDSGSVNFTVNATGLTAASPYVNVYFAGLNYIHVIAKY